MPAAFIYQIYYSSETRNALDEGFIGLDNMSNARPDWREYWPIRTHLMGCALVEDAYYGFFSPKFKSKTGLASGDVTAFIREQDQSADVLLFSPFFDQIAYPLNIFEQAAFQHHDTMRTFQDCALALALQVDVESLVMDSTNTVFCNYFVAKPAFWRSWLANCELIFDLTERATTDLASRLNQNTNYDKRGAPTKVFVIERIASLMLSTDKRWKARSYNPLSLPWSNAPIAKFRLEMAFLDSLKIAYASQGHSQYMEAFYDLRKVLGESLREK